MTKWVLTIETSRDGSTVTMWESSQFVLDPMDESAALGPLTIEEGRSLASTLVDVWFDLAERNLARYGTR